MIKKFRIKFIKPQNILFNKQHYIVYIYKNKLYIKFLKNIKNIKIVIIGNKHTLLNKNNTIQDVEKE